MTLAAPHINTKNTLSLGYGDHLRFSRLIQKRYGLCFPEKRYPDLERGIRQAFAASTCTDLNEYFDLLQDPDHGAAHFERLINALTVGETHFFRDAGQFDALYSHALPQIIERRRALRTLRIWSAGCASGEEPYSIAISLRQLLPDVDEWSITILGTDINTEALDRARKATYGEWAFREERAKQWQPHYFHRRGKRYELVSEVRRMVTFAQLNLAEGVYPAYETNTTLMDLILCRNVMMYFPEPVTRQIVERFYQALTDGGWLIVGHAEHSLITYQRFQTHNYPNAILYRRADHSSFLPKDWHWLILPPPKEEKPAAPTLATPLDTQPISQSPPGLPQNGQPNDSDPIEKACDLLNYGHSARARDLLLKAIEQNPRHAPTCALLGQAYANLGYWQEAEYWCRQATRMDKLALKAYYTLALVLQHQEQLDSAITAMKKVIYIDRHNVLGHFGLAHLYHNNNQLPQALKSLNNAYHLLNGRSEEKVIPDSGGITTASLRETIVRQQQLWSAEANNELKIERTGKGTDDGNSGLES
ncbi:MAG: hypothetical protein DRJ03_05870 [Chloroflexi bacterium]|nr:MAG: hypothetical protein B6I35_02375 [Anaerolineaceae bacterium 4572_32.2]RLC87490.1 MAG: hypothetical protein DRJ03_05870 [Chloroflexota bacterium]HEY74458.1 hypothetical protein [Thermoflexia bacterium]